MEWELDPACDVWSQYTRVIVFDGVCHWCNFWVDFVLRRDGRGAFKFATLQSDEARRLLSALHLPRNDFRTFLLVERPRVYGGSTAALRIARHLPGIWPLVSLLLVIPRPIRDALYRFVARHRYRWMGKADACRTPAPGERERFV